MNQNPFRQLFRMNELAATYATEPPPYLEGNGLVLQLSRDNPCNCTLSSGCEPVYIVSTSKDADPIITIKRVGIEGGVVGTVEWKETLGDKISVGGRTPKRFRSFFNRGLVGGGETARIEDDAGATWTWYGFKAGGQLTLMSPSNEVAASYHRISTYGPQKSTATLTIYPPGLRVRDLAVVTFVALEKNRRENPSHGIRLWTYMSQAMELD